MIDCINCIHYMKGDVLYCAMENSKTICVEFCDIDRKTSHEHECSGFISKY